MRPMTLRNGLVLIVVAALLPIGTLSVMQALSSLSYSRTLIGNQLITSALATAARERDPLIIAERIAVTVSLNQAVRAMGADCREGLKSGLIGNPAIVNLVRTDATGMVRCSVLPFPPSKSLGNEIWWQNGIKADGFTLTGPVVGPISKIPVLIGMQPIISPDGRVDGAINVGIDLSWLHRSLVNQKLAPNAQVLVVNIEGRVLMSNKPTLLPEFSVSGAQDHVSEVVAQDGTAWMYAFAPLYDKQLYIVYAEPTQKLMAKAAWQVRVDLILPIVALLAACLAIWIGTNRLVLRWLDSLRALAAQFAEGNFAGEPEKYQRAPREIGLLSADLHSMAHAIEARDHELVAALDAKTALTHDIHHRVKNNLQIVSSLLNLQAGKISDPAAREALSQTRARIGALAQIHRLLYEESHDSDHGNVNIANLLNALCSQLRSLHRGQNDIHLICDAASQTVPINNAVPLTLLAVEAVTNAYRHGFPAGQSGTIILHFDVTDEQATLCVTDDGIGLDATADSASMGRQLMAAFAQQLSGGLDIASAPGTGTVVKLTYPLLQEQEHTVLLPDP
jgi:two-component sensor histidine kinase